MRCLPHSHEQVPSPHPLGSVWPALSDDMGRVNRQRLRAVASPPSAQPRAKTAGDALRAAAAEQLMQYPESERLDAEHGVLAGMVGAVTDVLGLAGGVGSLVHHMVNGSPVELETPRKLREMRGERERFALHGHQRLLSPEKGAEALSPIELLL